jgi:hypothetical protein
MSSSVPSEQSGAQSPPIFTALSAGDMGDCFVCLGHTEFKSCTGCETYAHPKCWEMYTESNPSGETYYLVPCPSCKRKVPKGMHSFDQVHTIYKKMLIREKKETLNIKRSLETMKISFDKLIEKYYDLQFSSNKYETELVDMDMKYETLKLQTDRAKDELISEHRSELIKELYEKKQLLLDNECLRKKLKIAEKIAFE